MNDMDILHLDYKIDTEDDTSWKKIPKEDIKSTDKSLYKILIEKLPIILHTEDFECYQHAALHRYPYAKQEHS